MPTSRRIRLFNPVPSADAAARTPLDRDRVVDGVRAASLLIVVFGHFTMAVVAWPGGVPKIGNLLAAVPATQCITWLLQVMPLFFWAGGVANAISWNRHRSEGDAVQWLWRRAQRLLRPLWPYLIIMSAIAALVSQLAPTSVAEPLLLLTTQLLWFLGAYLIVTAMTPWFAIIAVRRGFGGVAVLIAACALVDIARFALGAPEAVGLLNFVFVWAVPALLGALRAQGTLARLTRGQAFAGAALALGVNALLVAFGPYPLSMVGMPGDPVSNVAPPTVVMAVHAVLLVLIVTAIDAPLQRLFQRARLWRATVAVNLVAMTLYLWHLPVLVAVTTLAHAVHLERPTTFAADGYPVPADWSYLLQSLPFAVVFAVLAWACVLALWPLEHIALPWWDSPTRLPRSSRQLAQLVAWVACLGVGVASLMLSATGLGGFPTRIVRYAGVPLSAAVALVLLMASGSMLRWAGTDRVQQ